MQWFLAWVVLSIIVGAIASSKGRSGLGFFALSIFLSPLVGLIAAFAAQSKESLIRYEASLKGAAGDFRKCPYCAEVIRKEAVKCRYCGSDVGPTEAPALPGGSSPADPPARPD